MLEAGTTAPRFALHDQNGREVRLDDFAGRRVVVYFYSRDNTSGCSRQAAAFAASYEEFRRLGVEVIGISRDSEASHAKFACKYDLPFLLLSDPDLQVIKGYDVWQEKNLYGKTSTGVVRTAYLVGKNGVIEQVWPHAKPDTNAADILAYLQTV